MGVELAILPVFCASPNATRTIIDYQAFTSLYKKVTKSGGFGNVLANLKKCLFLNCLELFFTLMGLENSLFVVDSAIFQLPYLIAKSAFCSQNVRNE